MNIAIGKRKVGPGCPAYIIFEVASTHANDWHLAKEYVKQAKESGADALKFQLFSADKLLNPISSILKPTYDYFKNTETPKEWFPRLKKMCVVEGIDLLCTPFDEDSATYLNKIGIPAVKIASGDLTNYQLLSYIAKFGKPVILSTGMATINEVQTAVETLKGNGCKEFILLQCTSVYPMPYEAANLKVIQTLQNKFKTVVGFSDNGSEGFIAPLVAVALGASVIEKHVTSRKERKNMDDIFSLSVKDFREMSKRIRKLEKDYQNNFKVALSNLKEEFGKDVDRLLGDGIKRPTKVGFFRVDGTYMSEDLERHWARRGVYPKRNIKKGTKITKEMLIHLRPDVGISAPHFQYAIGSYAIEELRAKKPLCLKDNKIRMFKKSDIYSTYGKEDKEFAKTLLETAIF